MKSRYLSRPSIHSPSQHNILGFPMGATPSLYLVFWFGWDWLLSPTLGVCTWPQLTNPTLYALEEWLFLRWVCEFSQTKRESVLQFHWNLGTAHSLSQELLGWLPISLVLLVAMWLPPEMKPAFRKAEGRDETEIPVTSSEWLDSAVIFSS